MNMTIRRVQNLVLALLAELAQAREDLTKRVSKPRKRKKAFYIGESLKAVVAKRVGWERLGGNVLWHRGGAMVRISKHDSLYDVAESVLRAEVVYATRNAPRRAQRQAIAAAVAALRAEEEKREGLGRLPL